MAESNDGRAVLIIFEPFQCNTVNGFPLCFTKIFLRPIGGRIESIMPPVNFEYPRKFTTRFRPLQKY